MINSYFGTIRLEQDSRFGRQTEEIVNEFQAALKIQVDGVIGPGTWSGLRNRGKPPVPCAAGIDRFDIRELECFFEGLRRRMGNTTEASNVATPAAHYARLTSPPNRAATSHSPAKQPDGGATNHSVPKVVSVQDFKRFQRTTIEGYRGRAYVVKDFLKFRRHAIQVAGTTKIVGPSDELGNIKNECAQFVQYFGIPHSSKWRRGPRVCDFKAGELVAGTVIATLRDNKYYSDYSGRSHVGLYLTHTNYQTYLKDPNKIGSLSMLDQFNGSRIEQRFYDYSVEGDKQGKKAKKQWTDSSGQTHTKRVQWSKDGEEYYVLLTEE